MSVIVCFIAALVLLLENADSLSHVSKSASAARIYDTYAMHWDNILTEEYSEAVSEMRERRKRWSRNRLEQGGLCIFDASAEPESDLFGEKVVRIVKQGETRIQDRFSRGDVLVITPTGRRSENSLPKECCVVDVGRDWLMAAVGPSWPAGLWEARRLGDFRVRVDRAAPQAPLKAQKIALQLVRNGKSGEAAALLAQSFVNPDEATMSKARAPPSRLLSVYTSQEVMAEAIKTALDLTVEDNSFEPNQSQRDAIVWALGRRISLVRGPPGTGKTRVAALLVATALRLRTDDASEHGPCRVLAVAHSNGAADVLLEGLLHIGVPAVRAGRPASVSPNVRHRTVIALADTHPEVVALRQKRRNSRAKSDGGSSGGAELRGCVSEVCQSILKTAPVIVTSCIGAHGLLDDDSHFPLVIVDEAAQTTEPALICALASAKAGQIVFIGDTQQLPPTVASQNPELRGTLGVSPMARLEKNGIGQQTLRIQYRMPLALLEHPSRYFYDSLVQCAATSRTELPPEGFPWPAGMPLAFVHAGSDLEVAHELGGKSNPFEAQLVTSIVERLLETGDVEAQGIAVISPYAKQIQRLRIDLSARKGCHEIRVGTVDSFQGQETDIVVFSAVRSNPLGELGFLRDPRRLCVAITRARRGLILVGDTNTLRTSKHWSALINYYQMRDCKLESKDLLAFWEKRTSQSIRGDMKSMVAGRTGSEDVGLDFEDEFYGLFND